MVRGAKQVFFAFVDGYDKPEFQGSLEEVEVALGLRPAGEPRPTPKMLRKYRVTGTNVFGEYETEVYASSNADAVKKIRQQRHDEDGRYAVPATVRARLAE